MAIIGFTEKLIIDWRMLLTTTLKIVTYVNTSQILIFTINILSNFWGIRGHNWILGKLIIDWQMLLTTTLKIINLLNTSGLEPQ